MNTAEKRVKRFMLDDATPRISELRQSFESFEEEKGDYQNLSFARNSSMGEDEDSLNMSNYSSPASFNKIKLMKAKTGEPISKNRKEASVNTDEEEMSFTRKSKDNAVSIKEPTNFLFKETFEQQSERMRKASVFGSLKTWKIMKMIVKSGDDLRQEQFAMQIIDVMNQIFQVNEVGCWLRPYEILATDDGCGIMVCLKDAMSIDQIKGALPSGMSTLKDYFLYNFGGQRSHLYKEARNNFAKSLAGYSLL